MRPEPLRIRSCAPFVAAAIASGCERGEGLDLAREHSLITQQPWKHDHWLVSAAREAIASRPGFLIFDSAQSSSPPIRAAKSRRSANSSTGASASTPMRPSYSSARTVGGLRRRVLSYRPLYRKVIFDV